MDITFYLFFMALLVSLASWCVFLWGIRTGQFDHVEEIKHQVWPSAGVRWSTLPHRARRLPVRPPQEL